jgi:phosphatidylinositol alpha 1,6-mannosyltransferase
VASSDILLNPSITEAFGNVTVEAMACRLPVVAAISTGSANIVRDGITGMLVNGTEEGEFADAMEMYIRDPELRHHHGEEGLAVAKTMDWDRINSAVIRTYIHAIHKRKRLDRIRGR